MTEDDDHWAIQDRQERLEDILNNPDKDEQDLDDLESIRNEDPAKNPDYKNRNDDSNYEYERYS
jgi:hypothetical protein